MSESLTLGDVIRRFGSALLEARGAAVTAAQKAVLWTLQSCLTAALGGHVYECDHCGAERIGYNACQNRHCPSCLGHKSAAWLQERVDELLPVPYFHVVFTIPQQLGAIALGNKKLVYSLLMRAAARTLLQIARDPKHLGADIGFLAILHTWTQTLLHHPHVHCVVPGGGLSPDRSRWISSRKGFFLPVRVLSALFRGKLLAMLDDAYRQGSLRFGGSTAQLADPARWAALMRRLRRMKWVVYSKAPFGSPQQVLKYLARYTHRVAIANRRILAMDDEHVTFRYRDRARGNTARTMTLDGVEFLRRFLLHVVPKSFVRMRYYGLFANRRRAENLERCRTLLGVPALDPQAPDAPAPHDDDDNDAPVDAEEGSARTESDRQSFEQPRHGAPCTACQQGHLRVRGLLPAAPRGVWSKPRDTS